MEENFYFGKLVSVIYRQGNRYYDAVLARQTIGSGQQFFLLRIQQRQGITALELASMGGFDKGTVAKALQRLTVQGYIRSEVDKKDRRIHHLYTTEKAVPLLNDLQEARKRWEAVLLEGMTQEEAGLAKKLLQKMAANAFYYVNQKECDFNES